eukprot:49978-Rhodomonas_salina.1
MSTWGLMDGHAYSVLELRRVRRQTERHKPPFRCCLGRVLALPSCRSSSVSRVEEHRTDVVLCAAGA